MNWNFCEARIAYVSETDIRLRCFWWVADEFDLSHFEVSSCLTMANEGTLGPDVQSYTFECWRWGYFEIWNICGDNDHNLFVSLVVFYGLFWLKNIFEAFLCYSEGSPTEQGWDRTPVFLKDLKSWRSFSTGSFEACLGLEVNFYIEWGFFVEIRAFSVVRFVFNEGPASMSIPNLSKCSSASF